MECQSSGTPFQELIVVDVAKDPTAPIPLDLTEEEYQQAIPASNPETCRWLGNEDAEVNALCVRIDVPGGSGETVNISTSLDQDLGGTMGHMNCSISATLSMNNNATTTYAMMLAYRNSTLLDEILFCGLVTCEDYPDCSKDCPFCITPYMGQATLESFYLDALVPPHFSKKEIDKWLCQSLMDLLDDPLPQIRSIVNGPVRN